MAMMMTCRELAERTTDYIEGRLSFYQRLRLWLHLSMCNDCPEYIRQMRHSIRVLRGLGNPTPPPGAREELVRRFRERR